MKPSCCALLLVLFAPAASAVSPLPPMQQLDYPVMAVGDVSRFRVQVPAYPGGKGRVAYAAHAMMPGSDVDAGYRFVAAECGEGFAPYVHYEDRGVVCSRFGDAPHAGFEMVVTVVNVSAAAGEALMPEGLNALSMEVGPTPSPWRLYGVR